MKKFTKIVIGIMCVLMIAWFIMFAIDYNRCSSLKEPIFVILQNGTANHKNCMGLGYTVEVETYFDKQYGKEIVCSVEMKVLGKMIAASIS